MNLRVIFIGILALIGVSAARAEEGCVVILHGISRTNISMVRVSEAAENAGYKVVNHHYPSRSAKIQELSETTLPEVLAECGDQPVSFVTHSMGGIVLRDYYARHKEAVRPYRVVMMAPPNKGSAVVDDSRYDEFGAWWFGPAGKQLGERPDSYVNQLPGVDYPVGVIAGNKSINPYFATVLEGENDGTVSVSNTAVEGMADWIVVNAGHSFIMDNPVVIEQTIHFLQHGEFKKPSS